MTSEKCADLPAKYRPKVFEDVEGQKHPVQFLQGLIRCGASRNILLHGSIGSGKTSLARIYAKALNCLTPTSSYSACGTCSVCVLPNPGLHEYNVSQTGGGETKVMHFVDEHNRPPHGYRYQILFFDEAHSLTAAACDALLNLVEEPPKWLVFVFATTEPDRLRRALLSRLYDLEVRTLSTSAAITFLKKVADKEGITVENDTLALLAGLKNGHVRDLVKGLGQVQGVVGNVITLADVRSVLYVDFSEQLIEYFLALARGDLAEQSRAFYDWSEPIASRVQWIKAFAVTLYHKNVRRIGIITDPLTASIADEERRPIVEEFCRRIGVNEPRELERAWLSMMEVLGSAPLDQDEATLQLWTSLFHDFVNNSMVLSRVDHVELVEDDGRVPHNTMADDVTSKAAYNVRTSSSSGYGNGFINVEDVRTIINLSSYFAQEHGAFFNASVEVNAGLFGCEDQATSMRLVEEFEKELEREVAGWSKKGRFARITLFECYEKDYRGLLILRLPRSAGGGQGDDCLTAADEWCRAWRAGNRTHPVDQAIRFKSEASDARELAFHWRATLNLCAGLDSTATMLDQAGRERPLVELLGLRRPREDAVTGLRLEEGRRPFSVSALLSEEVVAEACQYGLLPLFAFDDRAWDRLRTGWERHEYRDRCRAREARKPKAEVDRQLHGRISRDAWPVDPHDRERTWPVWPKGATR